MALRVLYLEGDPCSPKYVQGTLERAGVDVRRAAPGDDLPHLAEADVVLLSDFPADDLGDDGAEELVDAAEDGTGLLFVGGWRSFGAGGWADSPLAEALPVGLEDGDDRVNVPSGMFLFPSGTSALTDGLLFDPPPVVTGFNRCIPLDDADVVLHGRVVADVTPREATLADHEVPVLVVGRCGEGRVAALATDLAPHWSGGWTDWGTRRIDVGRGEEVGDAYRDFLGRLANWSARKPEVASARRS